MAIQAITFDFWRTLFRHIHSDERRRHRIHAFHAATGADPEAVDTAMAFAEAEFSRIHIGEHRTLGPNDAVRIMAEHLEIVLTPDMEDRLATAFAKGILDPPPPIIEGAAQAVRAAAERFPVGLISDTGFSPGRYLRELLADHGLLDCFRVLVFSDEVGLSKPMPILYETAVAGLGIQLHELLHIGDLEWTDIVGAKRLGAKAALYAGDNDRHLHDNTADYVLHSWDDFIELLPTLD